VPRRELPRWLRPVGGAAIAAGVAAVAVMVLQPDLDAGQQLGTPIPSAANGSASQAANDRYIVPPAAPQMVPAAALAGYVMAHAEVAGPLNRRALLSSVLSDDDDDDALTAPLAIDVASSDVVDDAVPPADSKLQRQ
jgi:sigma-E factor negative regulatory protein RseA